MAIAYQPAMTPDPIRARSVLPRSPHGLVPVNLPPRAWTFARLAGLLAATAVCVALVSAVVAGAALFTLFNFGS
jgi:hypothetical protein